MGSGQWVSPAILETAPALYICMYDILNYTLWDRSMILPECLAYTDSEVGSHGKKRTGLQLWKCLKSKLENIAAASYLVGNMSTIYESTADADFKETKSNFEKARARRCFFLPDTGLWSKCWDMVQAVMLSYIAISVPFCFGFDIATTTKSVVFWVEAAIDTFFIVDVIINFRTAYYDRKGTLRTDTKDIAKNYLTHLFAVDFVACLPVSYGPRRPGGG